jgi:hypothetical protein
MSEPQLHSSIVALVSLASGIAAKHPDMGLCQLDKLRKMGVPETQIQSVIEIARHIRDEAAQKLDAAFDAKGCPPEGECCAPVETAAKPKIKIGIPIKGEGSACCTPTKSGQSCC